MISINNVRKTFGKTTALDGISAEIKNGCIYGLVGSNGSGKSTLLRLLSGVYIADDGNITVDGEAVFDNPVVKNQILFLGDTPSFFANASLKEMAKFYSSMYVNFDYSIYYNLLSVFPLDENARLSSFSKGMMRQASLILAISTNPRYIFLDEAFDGLDVVMRKVLSNILLDGVVNRGLTVIIASHNLRELEDMCDHVMIIHKGKVVVNDNIENLRGSLYKLQVAFNMVPEMNSFDGLNVVKCERKGSILQMVVRGVREDIMAYMQKLNPVFVECIEPTLEEIFLFEMEVTGYDVKNILP